MPKALKIILAVANTLLSLGLGYAIVFLASWGYAAGGGKITAQDGIELIVFPLLIGVGFISMWVVALKPSTHWAWKTASFGSVAVALFFVFLIARSSGFFYYGPSGYIDEQGIFHETSK